MPKQRILEESVGLLSKAFICSLFLKGIGAVLEITCQVILTRSLGVSDYGSYSAYVNAAGLILWCLFSGIVKCNTFYLSKNGGSIKRFKRKYYTWYVIPLLVILAVCAAIFTRQTLCILVFLISSLELLMLDQSSVYLAQGRSFVSLFGEYVAGRLVLVFGMIFLAITHGLSIKSALMLYSIQFVCVLIYYWAGGIGTKKPEEDLSAEVTLKKWGAYQRADVVQALISQMPVLVQYLFSGAFNAGVVSIVLLVKKLINFVSGPTAKVFLPEFSRLYHSGEKETLRSSFARIMQLQMLFVGPMAVILLGFPKVILGVFEAKLADHSALFAACACVFLVAASLGPCGGVMQMSGSEKQDNYIREAALVIMLLVMAVFYRSELFVLYGLCAHTVVESVGKYIFLCWWFEKAPAGILDYGKWWLIPALLILAAHVLKIDESFMWMMILAGICGVNCLTEVYRRRTH